MSQGAVCDRVGEVQKPAYQNLYFYCIFVMYLYFDTFSLVNLEQWFLTWLHVFHGACYMPNLL